VYTPVIESVSDVTDLDICKGQTSGVINIGVKTNRTGAINIGTGATATSSGVFLGNSFTPTTVKGNLSVLGSFSYAGSAFNNLTSVLNTDNTSIYDNQTSGTLSIGGSTTRTGSISIGTNPTSTANGIFIGNNNNLVTITNLTVTGTLTAPSSTTSFNTLTTTLATDTASLYNNQTSGIINLGNDVSRTGSIFIGNGNTQINVGSYRFTGLNIEGIFPTSVTYSIMNNLTTAHLRIGHSMTSGNLELANNKTAGDINIINNGVSSGNINIMDNGNGIINMIRNSTTTGAVNIANTWKIWKNNFEFYNFP
jgi:hypothetical protein